MQAVLFSRCGFSGYFPVSCVFDTIQTFNLHVGYKKEVRSCLNEFWSQTAVRSRFA
jgi:hypothetical protein